MATIYLTVGEERVVDIIDGTASPAALDTSNNFTGWGTGTTGAVKGDTGLETASSESRSAGTVSQPSASINQWVSTITSTQTQTISEAVLFTAVTSGVAIIRGDFTGIALTNGDKIEFTISLEQQ